MPDNLACVNCGSPTVDGCVCRRQAVRPRQPWQPMFEMVRIQAEGRHANRLRTMSAEGTVYLSRDMAVIQVNCENSPEFWLNVNMTKEQLQSILARMNEKEAEERKQGKQMRAGEWFTRQPH